MSAPVVAAHAEPQRTGEVELHGYVAARCWVADLAAQPAANSQVPRGRAICNQATPLLRSSVRQLDADGRIINSMQQAGLSRAANSQSSRAAMEIVVSPQI